MTVQSGANERRDRTGDEPAVQRRGESGTDDGDADGELSLDTAFGVLQNERRRRVLRHLWNREDGGASLGDLAEHVAAIENGTTPEALTAKQRKRVYVGLYQSHLPKLDEAGVVEFDQKRGEVELTERSDQLKRYLDADGAGRERYAVPAAVGTALLLYAGAAVALPTTVALVAGAALIVAVGVVATVVGG